MFPGSVEALVDCKKCCELKRLISLLLANFITCMGKLRLYDVLP